MKQLISILFLFFFSLEIYSNDVVYIDKTKEKSKKIALVILNGIGDSKKNRKVQLNFFKEKGMDIYIPNYKQRSSLDESLYKFSVFFDDYEIERYDEVYFMCYIIGGYVLNRYIELYGKKNIKKIIYDRSPTQERAARIGVDKLPFFTRLKYGQLVFDFSEVKLKSLENKFDIKIEVGGGVRNFDSIQKYTDAGVEKVILGSAAINDKEFLENACKKFPNKIALGLDAKDGYLAVSGWKKNSNLKTLDFLKEVNDYGVSRLIYTDINKDGMKTSPNFEGTEKIANTSNFPVIISGGVSSIEDIKRAKELHNKNIEGIIVGKAIYDGDIKLEDLAKEINA